MKQRLCRTSHTLKAMKQNIGKKLALYPTPATVVGTIGEGNKTNWLLVAHVGIVSHSKLLLSIHSSHYSIKAIDATKRLSVNIIDETFVAIADYTGTVSGAKIDKSGVFDYHLGEAGLPIIEQSPLAMECEVIDTYEIDGFKNYICNILGTYIDEDKLDENDKPDYTKIKPVLFEMPTYKYLRSGDIIGDCVKMGKAFGQAL